MTQYIPVRADRFELEMEIAQSGGPREPIVLLDDLVIEGRIRQMAVGAIDARQLQYKRYQLISDKDPLDWMVEKHIQTHEPTWDEKLALVDKLLPYYEKRGGSVVVELAKLVKVAEHTVRKVRALKKRGRLEPVLLGEITLNDALREAGIHGYGVDKPKLRKVFGRGDPFDEATEPFVRYMGGWKAKGYEFSHINPKEAERRVKVLQEMAAGIRGALADLEPRSVRPRHTAPAEKRKKEKSL